MLALDKVSLSFGEKVVLDHFSLTLPDQGILCLSGPSGCGKTTLLRVLCGLEHPQAGTVHVSSPVAAVFQEDRLLPWLSVQRNLTAATGMPHQEALQWLARVGLQEEAGSLPSALSGGMRRRVAIARALGAKSQLLLLDEPFTGLDAATRQQLYPWLMAAAQEKPLLLVTHHPEEAQALSAQVLSLTGPPLQILQTEPSS
jgi:NitT/TauT family transport system ATP-binding protein